MGFVVQASYRSSFLLVNALVEMDEIFLKNIQKSGGHVKPDMFVILLMQ